MSLQLRKASSGMSVREAALNLLARREHCRAEMVQKLALRGYAGAEIQSVLDALEAQHLLSEERYVAAYVRSRMARNYGPQRILAELRQRGAGAAAIREALDPGDGCWLTLARQYYKRHFSGHPVDDRDRARRWRHMQQRGFDTGILGTLLGDKDGGDAP